MLPLAAMSVLLAAAASSLRQNGNSNLMSIEDLQQCPPF